jgi:type IV pilus biogenesis protein CpaD/CtpE
MTTSGRVNDMTARISHRRLSGLACAGLLAALAACTPAPPFIPDSSYRTGPSEIAFSLYFRQGSAEVSAGEVARTREILGDMGLRAGDDISVRIGVTGNEALDEGRLATAAAVVAGTPARVRIFGTEPSPLGAGTADIAVVEVIRNGRIVVVCPTPAIDSWERDRLLVNPPVACANALNIAKMAARPIDLVAPGSLRGSDAITSVAAVDRYRTDTVKEPVELDTIGN